MISSFCPTGANDSIKEIVSANGIFKTTTTDEETFHVSEEVLHNKPLFSFFYYVNPDLVAGHSREWNSENIIKQLLKLIIICR